MDAGRRASERRRQKIMGRRYFESFKEMSDADRRRIVEAALEQIRTREPQRIGLYLGGTFYTWDGTIIEAPNALTDSRQGELEHGTAELQP